MAVLLNMSNGVFFANLWQQMMTMLMIKVKRCDTLSTTGFIRMILVIFGISALLPFLQPASLQEPHSKLYTVFATHKYAQQA